jgi:hypothetical protein
MSSTETRARKLAKRLIQENHNGRTWRDIASDYPGIVKAGTLNRIAKSGGKWLPKDKEILSALNLIKPRPKYERPEWMLKWYRLSKDERWKVIKDYLEGKT